MAVAIILAAAAILLWLSSRAVVRRSPRPTRPALAPPDPIATPDPELPIAAMAAAMPAWDLPETPIINSGLDGFDPGGGDFGGGGATGSWDDDDNSD